MPGTLLALQVLLILLPGFTAAYIVQALASRRSQSDFERVIEALVFSFIVLRVLCPAEWGKAPISYPKRSNRQGLRYRSWRPAKLAWLATVTLIFSLVVLTYIRLDANRFFRKIGLSERTTRNSIWNDIFGSEAEPGQPVQVELADGRFVIGNLLYYSDVAEDASLYLNGASWVDANGNTVPIPGHGILLTKGSGIRSISLLTPASPSELDAELPTDE